VIYQPFFLEGVAGLRELNQADGIHPNQAGVRVMIQGIMPYVERLLERVR
jgi:acyl-CoA thioesterase-1